MTLNHITKPVRRKKAAQVPHLTPASSVGVDSKGNPSFGNIIPELVTEFDDKILRVPLVRNVDWRDGIVQNCLTAYAKRSALVQRTGRVAPAGQACTGCVNGEGPFKECVVLVFEGELIYNGACANCCFLTKPYNCSFRTTLPTWVFDWLKQQNPSHRIMIETNAKNKKLRLQEEFFPMRTTKKAPATTSTSKPSEGLEPKRELESKKELEIKKELEPERESEPKRTVEKFGPVYNNTWYQSPLDDPTLFSSDEEGFAKARLAYRSHDMLITRAYFDHAWLKRYLEMHDRLDSSSSEMEDSMPALLSAVSLADQ